LKFSNFLRSKKLDKLYIFYPSIRLKIAGKLAGIPEVNCYPLFRKNKLHLIKAAQNFTKQALNIDDCKTETKFFISQEEEQKSSLFIKKEKKNIFIGASSSGPTNQWSIENFIKLINKIKQKVNSHFFVLVGKDEAVLSEKIINEIGKENATSVHDLPINQISSIASCCDFYIGNDTFPHHICCQRSIPSIVLLIDTPRAYSDYSKHQHQITPENISLDDIKHGTRAGPDSIKVEKVFNKFLELLD
jgi:ADP-heptose:LPS heptosyltransferase